MSTIIIGPKVISTCKIPKKALTFSTCSVVKGPPYYFSPSLSQAWREAHPHNKLGTAMNWISMVFGKVKDFIDQLVGISGPRLDPDVYQKPMMFVLLDAKCCSKKWQWQY